MASEKSEVSSWMIRPCHVYKEEYDDCRSFKARFNQYFIFGKDVDCEPWGTDYRNCKKYYDENDKEAGARLEESEENRRMERFRGHYGNTTWKKRKAPPSDWNKPLPEWLAKQNENSYLALKTEEIKNGHPSIMADRTLCVIM